MEWTIGELAGHFGLATHVLRHWETVGLLRPQRQTNGRRRYTEADRTRVAIIVHGRRAGFGLDELRTVLTAEAGATRRDVLRRRRADLDLRIAEAQASRDLVDHVLECDSEDFLRCPNFQRLVNDLDQPGCPPGPAAP